MSEFTVKPINAYFIALIIGFIVTLSVSIWKKDDDDAQNWWIATYVMFGVTLLSGLLRPLFMTTGELIL